MAESCMKTLVLDDDPFALKLLDRQLEHLGVSPVLLVERAEQALDLLRAEGDSIGLVFCDLQMPGTDGVEFVRHLAGVGWHGGLVLVSGEDPRVLQTAERLARAHGIRLLGAISKPVAVAQLREIVEHNSAGRVARVRRPGRSRSPDELRRAIEAGELTNHYQPKVSLVTGELVGAEALVRWRHPEAGLVYPDQFIGVAEEHGLIDALTRAVLEVALRQVRTWLDTGLALHVSVNVSMDNLASLDFPDVVAAMAHSARVPLSAVVLEVTESRLMKDVLAPLDILTRLRLKRIGLAIDDFGTGHSSLAQLRDLPFDELKLDRSFVSGAVNDASLAAIVDGTLAMARQLGITSVAEGVEERTDWDFLVEHGCDVAQGYFIAKPMSGEALPAWAGAWMQRRQELGRSAPS
ncbi:MAG: EAL domain-containing response regulator [Rubrivivax sp.]|nr:EAL domain-containing response regulator [Rubrivivax sp.]